MPDLRVLLFGRSNGWPRQLLLTFREADQIDLRHNVLIAVTDASLSGSHRVALVS